VEFIYEKDPQELMKTSAILEDIDLYINKLKTKQNKSVITVDKSKNLDSETKSIPVTTKNIFNSSNQGEDDQSENSIFNFIKNTKKLHQAGTLENKPIMEEKVIEKESSKKEIKKVEVKKEEKEKHKKEEKEKEKSKKEEKEKPKKEEKEKPKKEEKEKPKEEKDKSKEEIKNIAISFKINAEDTIEKKPVLNTATNNQTNHTTTQNLNPNIHYFTDSFKASNLDYGKKNKPEVTNVNNTEIKLGKNNAPNNQVNTSLEQTLVSDFKKMTSKRADPQKDANSTIQFTTKEFKELKEVKEIQDNARQFTTNKESGTTFKKDTGPNNLDVSITSHISTISPKKTLTAHPNGIAKSLETEIATKINTVEIKERRKTKILEMAQNTPIYWKISKDQMIKISNEPISQHYVVLGDLGNGSYGTVKKVKHKKLGEERAMKIVKKKSESSVNEIDILKKISHPNIISIYEIFEDAKSYYIMTELLDGGELFEEISNRGSFSEIDAGKILKQLLSAVNYLHNKNIVHRDLKPENVMMINKNSNNFEIKIIDFGTAKTFDNKTEKLTKFIGTSYYIAPEVLAECYDEKCDIWSCGVILYILFCGYPPFSGASNLDIYHAIKYSSPNFSSDEWRDVSKDAIDLITCMLTKNPTKRYSAEQCLNHKWLKTMEGIEGDSKSKIKFNPLKAIKKMTAFLQENKLKQTVIQFISTQFNLKEEEQSMRSLFEQFDNEKKGVISIQTFTEILSKIFGENEAKLYAEKIFNNIDNDGNGEISYNEFITSLLDKRMLEKNQRIEKAFKLIDKVKDYNFRMVMVEYR
jgi:calcium-dependent protein kinase